MTAGTCSLLSPLMTNEFKDRSVLFFFFKSKRMFLAFPAVENAYMYVITVYTLHFVLCGLSAFDSWWEYIVAEINTIAFIRLLFSFEIRDTVHPSGHSY